MLRKIIEWLYFRQPGNLAYYDRLTRLLNRNWREIYAKNKLKNKIFYLALLDIDGLKEINDIKGHSAGDKIIVNFSQALQKHFPKDYLIRLGGDEFIIISKTAPEQKLLELQNDFNFSFGVSYKEKEITFGRALKKADKKMYIQKQFRKACV